MLLLHNGLLKLLTDSTVVSLHVYMQELKQLILAAMYKQHSSIQNYSKLGTCS